MGQGHRVDLVHVGDNNGVGDDRYDGLHALFDWETIRSRWIAGNGTKKRSHDNRHGFFINGSLCRHAAFFLFDRLMIGEEPSRLGLSNTAVLNSLASKPVLGPHRFA